jgi:hypothetical protein
MKKLTLLFLLLTLASCASMLTQHRMKAANRKLLETQVLQSQGQWVEALAMANGMHSSVIKSVDDKPVRQSSSGAEVDLRQILAAWENGPWTELAAALEQQDEQRFTRAFTSMKQQCANCHLVLGRTDIKIAE